MLSLSEQEEAQERTRLHTVQSPTVRAVSKRTDGDTDGLGFTFDCYTLRGSSSSNSDTAADSPELPSQPSYSTNPGGDFDSDDDYFVRRGQQWEDHVNREAMRKHGDFIRGFVGKNEDSDSE